MDYTNSTLKLLDRWKGVKKNMVTIVVHDNNVEQALRVLKKKMQREGSLREMKLRRYYEKPSEKKLRKATECLRRSRKMQRKRNNEG